MARIHIIGSGFSGLASACYAAKNGHKVSVFEKNETPGGRARCFKEEGFMFDMGPSWYWMPDVFESFFAHFGKSTSDYFKLVKLDPSFQIFFNNDQPPLIIPSELTDLYEVFEGVEKGAADQLRKFLAEGKLKYDIAMNQLIYRPALSWMEYATWDVLKGVWKTDIFKSMSAYTRKFFKDERLIRLMEFPVLFLGAMPDKIPALYSLMNYSAFSMGTWYPMGGMYEIVDAMQKLATSLGVDFKFNTEITNIHPLDLRTIKIETKNQESFISDILIATGDYNHVEQKLLKKEYQNYNANYWESKTFAPSCLIFYIGVSEKINKLLHHNLFFDTDFDKHSKEIYENPQWPENPLFYVSCPSKTDNSVAPDGSENLFILIPIAAGLRDTEQLREENYSKVMIRLEKICGQEIRTKIVYKKSYCVNDFIADYHAYKGNAYGLANTLTQTAVLKPSMKNKKIDQLFYAGQLTVPGPGVPPSLISGKIAADQAQHYFEKNKIN